MMVPARSFMECYRAVSRQVERIAKSHPNLRQEYLAGIHNPWGYNATGADPWAFLDICEHSEIIGRVEEKIGPDLILWDSELYLSPNRHEKFLSAGREGRYWPFERKYGAFVIITLDQSGRAQCFTPGDLPAPFRIDESHPLYVIRYMSAHTHFERDMRYPANWMAMEEQVLVNLSTRPLWLMQGIDRAENDFVTGFSTPAPLWSGVPTWEA